MILAVAFWASVAGGLRAERAVSFQHDVMPHLIKAGCAGGNCHAKPEGQNNFKLSVFGYDLWHDYREMVQDARGRRVFLAQPEESLLVKKALGRVPHEGGARVKVGSETHKLLVEWIRQGARFELEDEPGLVGVSVNQEEWVAEKGQTIQLQVKAKLSDGTEKDVTELAEYLSQHAEMARVDEGGLVTVGDSSGEGVLVVRYMGQVAVVRVVVPADQRLPDEVYARLPVNNEIDKLVHERHRKLGLLPSELCSDEVFLRRASLDLVGVLPDAELVRAFLADTAKDKRARVVETILQHPNYADHWAVKWADLIRPNPSRVGVKPVYLLDDWLRAAFRENLPYDQMIRELLTAEGSSHDYGPVALFRDKREPTDMGAFVSQIFLGVRLDCAKCHHHPSEKWGQEDYYALGAFFAQMKRKGQAISAPISGEVEHWWYGGSGSVKHPVTDEEVKPRVLDGPEMPYEKGVDPRVKLVEWMGASNNPFFAKAVVNRIWAEFLGRGIVEPVDDFRASNPPSNPELLEWLAQDFTTHGYDLKHLMKRIVLSRTYQLSAEPNATNVADNQNFSRFMKRRLTAEVLADAVADVTGVRDAFQGLARESRAVQTWNHKLKSDFLDAFGRPNASQECPCERERKPSVVQALHLMNSTDLQQKLTAAQGRVKQLAADEKLTPPAVVRELYLAAYTRLPDAEEMRIALRLFAQAEGGRQMAVEDLLWALINSAEFVFSH